MADVIFNVAIGADDGVGSVTGSYWNNGLNLNPIGRDLSASFSWHSFLRFDSVTIPSGAVIDSAVIRSISGTNESGVTVNVNIHFEAADDPLAPTSRADLIGRSLGAAVAWNNVGAWTQGSTYDTPDLTAELQAVIDLGGWNSGQAITCHLVDNASSNNANRGISAYENITYAQAQLVVSYHLPYELNAATEAIEISESISIESDLITQENIEVTESVEIEVEFIGEIPTITEDIEISEYIEISDLPLGEVSNSESIELSESIEVSLSVLPDFTLSVSSGQDDGYTGTASPFNVRASERASIGKDSTDPKRAYFRFQNVPIVGGYSAVIDSAILRVESQSVAGNNICNVTIHFQAHDNPGAFAATAQGGTDILTAPLTTGVDWDDIEDWSPGEISESPQLKTALQEIVDRVGWSSGNAVTVIIVDNGSDTDAERRIKTYDYFPSNTAELIISYTIPFHLTPVESIGISESVSIEMDLIEHENIVLSESITLAKSIMDLPAKSENINVSESIQMQRGFAGEIPAIVQNVNISEFTQAVTSLVISTFESITVNDYGNIQPEISVSDNLSLAESVTVRRGYQVAVDESFSFSDTFTLFNYTSWFRANKAKSKERYFFTLTGATDNTTDIEIPVSSIYATKRSGDPSYLQVVVPSLNYSGEIAIRSNAQMQVDIGYEHEGVINLREQILVADLDDIRVDEGPVNRSITLSGHRTIDYGGNLVTFSRSDVTYRAVQTRARVFRFAFIDPFLNPGDTVVIDYESFTCNNIVYIINPKSSMMEVREAL